MSTKIAKNQIQKKLTFLTQNSWQKGNTVLNYNQA